jgi:hypothetical protein
MGRATAETEVDVPTDAQPPSASAGTVAARYNAVRKPMRFHPGTVIGYGIKTRSRH